MKNNMHLLKRIRLKFEKTQGELAKELGVSQSALSQVELNNNVPSMKIFLTMVYLGYIEEKEIYDIIQELIDLKFGE